MNGAARVTYRQAREMKTPISEIALYRGLRCATTDIAQPIAIPANKMKSRANIKNVNTGAQRRACHQSNRDTCAPGRTSSSPTCGRFQKLTYIIKRARPLQRRRQNDVDDCERDQKLPAKIHQLIEAKTRQRSAQPNVKEKKKDYLAEKVKDAQPRQLMHERAIPAAEEQRRRQHRDREHVQVLGDKKQSKLHRAIF